MSTGIVLMSRAPIPGKTKTRLESHLQPEECATLHKAFLKDMSSMLLELKKSEEDINLYLTYTPPGTEDMFEGLVPDEFDFFAQQGEDLGRKMYNSLVKVSRENKKQIIVGSDLPTLQPQVFKKAIAKLSSKDVVIGPSQDGGYYLLGTKEPREFLFSDILWGKNNVLRATIEAVKAENLKYGTVDSWSDIDVYPELLEMVNQLREEESWQHYPQTTAEAVVDILDEEEIIRREEISCPKAR